MSLGSDVGGVFKGGERECLCLSISVIEALTKKGCCSHIQKAIQIYGTLLLAIKTVQSSQQL